MTSGILMKALGLLLAVLAALACTKVDTFSCVDSSDCVLAGVAGVCEPGNLCSFPDDDCPSGKSYGDYAGDQANQCVAGEPGTTSGTSALTDTSSLTDTSATTGDTDACTADTTTTGCGPACTVDANGAANDLAKCDGAGRCQHNIVSCGTYGCDPNTGTCRTTCMNASDCNGTKCKGSKCQ
jgi:hypothetical protein